VQQVQQQVLVQQLPQAVLRQQQVVWRLLALAWVLWLLALPVLLRSRSRRTIM